MFRIAHHLIRGSGTVRGLFTPWVFNVFENGLLGATILRKILILAAAGLAISVSNVRAQVDLSAYADAEGFLNVQTLTCAQLANTWQGDADRLASWYSGWYNGLAKKHYMDITKGKEAEHEVIVYCKAHPELRIIQAMEVVFKDMRQRLGIEVK